KKRETIEDTEESEHTEKTKNRERKTEKTQGPIRLCDRYPSLVLCLSRCSPSVSVSSTLFLFCFFLFVFLCVISVLSVTLWLVLRVGLLQKAAFEHFLGPVELGLPHHLGRAVEQAVAELFQRVAAHVRALVAGAGDARHGVVAVLRRLGFELPHHVRLGGDEDVLRPGQRSDVAQHRLGAADEVAVLADVRRALRVGD